jgi:hypothetical protein
MSFFLHVQTMKNANKNHAYNKNKSLQIEANKMTEAHFMQMHVVRTTLHKLNKKTIRKNKSRPQKLRARSHSAKSF